MKNNIRRKNPTIRVYYWEYVKIIAVYSILYFYIGGVIVE